MIWDFGGVLTTSPFEAFARYERDHDLPRDFLRKVNATNHLDNAWAQIERGAIGHAVFDTLFAEESRALGHEVRGAEILLLLAGDPRPEMIEALRRVGARLKTGCITNNVPETAGGGERTIYKPEVMALFDCVIESAKIGLRKPDPRIYAMMAEALGVEPTQCAYLDDLGVNLKPARAMGMRTIKVSDPAQALAELEAVVGFPLR